MVHTWPNLDYVLVSPFNAGTAYIQLDVLSFFFGKLSQSDPATAEPV